MSWSGELRPLVKPSQNNGLLVVRASDKIPIAQGYSVVFEGNNSSLRTSKSAHRARDVGKSTHLAGWYKEWEGGLHGD